MFTPLHNVHVLRKLITIHNPVTCLSIRSLKITGILKNASARTPEAVFLKANPEVPIIAVTDKDNVDIIGPPDSVSNLRPIVRKVLLNETSLQRQLRMLQDKTQEWNQKFWSQHNLKFIQERQKFIKSHKISIEENRILTADEMSEFYKKFLDENWKIHKFIAGPKLTEPYEPSIRRLRQQLHTYLPASAFNIKLFDEIGNNSKSSVIYEHSYITLRFEARYPLERSWKTSYVLQYNVPIYEYLRKSKSMFFLKMRVVDHILPNTIIREARTKVILPQDSEIVSVTVSGGIPRSPDELSDTALSFKRPTVVFIARNVPENFVPDFYITYKTPILGTFKPALLISFYIEIVLISCIAFRRIDMYLRSS